MSSEHIDPKEFKKLRESVERIEEALLGSIQNGTTTKGLFEQVRVNNEDIKALKEENKTIKELSKNVESLYRWKGFVIGGALVVLFLFEKVLEFTFNALAGLFVTHK